MSDTKTICTVCNKMDQNVTKTVDLPRKQILYECPRCGTYTITEKAEHLARNEASNTKLSAWIRDFKERGETPPLLTEDNIERIISSLPNYDVLEKQLKLLQNLDRKSKFPGDRLLLIPSNDIPLSWAENEDEFMYHINSLGERNLIETEHMTGGSYAIITPEGWEYLDKHQSDIEERTQVFVAMSFNPELKSIWEDAIKTAIKEAGYNPYRVDVEPHNQRIDAKIMAEIKNSRFIVADFTENKHGVYFEAGYALGLGIPVIWCVRKEDLEKLHFDTRQYGHIDWKNEVELKEKLYNYICTLIGKRK